MGYHLSIIWPQPVVKCISGLRRSPFVSRADDQSAFAMLSEPVEEAEVQDQAPGERASISEQAYQHLRSLIIERALTPGTIVAERRLAEQLNASRTPLRAAINRLEGERLVERLSNGSIVIREVSIDELMEILSIRRLLEGEAAALAASRLSAADVAPILEESRALAAEPEREFEEFWRYDDRFHEQIAIGSGKPLLAALICDLRNKARMCNLLRMQKNFREQANEHVAVLEAIAASDAQAARGAMARHVDQVRARLISWLTSA